MSPEDRLDALRNAPPDGWVAFSSDETRLVAYGENGERDPVILKVPKNWLVQVLSGLNQYFIKPAASASL